MNIVGIEIGGSKLQLRVADADTLEPQATLREAIVAADGAEAIRSQIVRLMKTVQEDYHPKAIGIGFGGPVDAQTGTVYTSHQVTGWDDFPLAHWCQDQFSLPAMVRNDCDAAALAEAKLGAGREAQSVFYVTVGSGIGGGFVVDGKLQGTARPAFAEIGHLRPSLNSVSPQDTVESLASGFGIAEQVRNWLRDGDPAEYDEAHQELYDLCGGQIDTLSTLHIAKAAKSGNMIARYAVDGAAEALGWAIAQVVTLLAPEVVILGGGVVQMPSELFWKPLQKQVAIYTFPPLANHFQILPARLGDAVVLQGALLLAQQSVLSAPD